MCFFSQVKSSGTLLMVEFSDLSDFLFLLRGVAEVLAPHGPTVMLYLAAAVSDFYIPYQDMVRPYYLASNNMRSLASLKQCKGNI